MITLSTFPGSMDSTFWNILKKLIGLSVRVYVDDFSFHGKLTDLEPHYLTLASCVVESGTTTHTIGITYIPLRKVQAVSRQ